MLAFIAGCESPGPRVYLGLGFAHAGLVAARNHVRLYGQAVLQSLNLGLAVVSYVDRMPNL